MSKQDTVEGVVIEALPNSQFKVELEGPKEIRAYLAGKMKMHRIRVLVGDKVAIVLDKYGDSHRIVTRL